MCVWGFCAEVCILYIISASVLHFLCMSIFVSFYLCAGMWVECFLYTVHEAFTSVEDIPVYCINEV